MWCKKVDSINYVNKKNFSKKNEKIDFKTIGGGDSPLGDGQNVNENLQTAANTNEVNMYISRIFEQDNNNEVVYSSENVFTGVNLFGEGVDVQIQNVTRPVEDTNPSYPIHQNNDYINNLFDLLNLGENQELVNNNLVNSNKDLKKILEFPEAENELSLLDISERHQQITNNEARLLNSVRQQIFDNSNAIREITNRMDNTHENLINRLDELSRQIESAQNIQQSNSLESTYLTLIAQWCFNNPITLVIGTSVVMYTIWTILSSFKKPLSVNIINNTSHLPNKDEINNILYEHLKKINLDTPSRLDNEKQAENLIKILEKYKGEYTNNNNSGYFYMFLGYLIHKIKEMFLKTRK